MTKAKQKLTVRQKALRQRQIEDAADIRLAHRRLAYNGPRVTLESLQRDLAERMKG